MHNAKIQQAVKGLQELIISGQVSINQIRNMREGIDMPLVCGYSESEICEVLSEHNLV